MVQVDVFWSYGLSAGLALAGKRIITTSKAWWDNEAFLWTTVWTACVFAPSGVYLLWLNPGWETMFVARDYSSLPPWLVALFALTNVTQGILGFAVTSYYLRAGKSRTATLQTIWAHVAMLLILVVGWDGTGYQRFFYAGTGEQWHSGITFPLSAFWSSPIFFGLLSLGIVFLPTYFGLIHYLRRKT